MVERAVIVIAFTLVATYSSWQLIRLYSADLHQIPYGSESRAYTHTKYEIPHCHELEVGASCCPNDCESSSKQSRQHENRANGGNGVDLAEFIKNSRDLYAQEGMWRATTHVAWLTLLQIFLGLLGLIAIFYTLHFTRKAADDARETVRVARMGQRAYLQLLDLRKSAFESNENRIYIDKAIYKIKNFGETHASNIKTSETLLYPDNFRRDNPVIDFTDKNAWCANFAKDDARGNIMPGQEIPSRDKNTSWSFERRPAGSGDCGYWIRVAYTDVFGHRRCEEALFRLKDGNWPAEPVGTSNLRYKGIESPEEIEEPNQNS